MPLSTFDTTPSTTELLERIVELETNQACVIAQLQNTFSTN